MAVLGDSERFEVWAQVMREQPMPGITKPELRAAVNALDTWLNDNAAAANAALPQPARGALWDRSVFSAINVASGDSISFQYTCTINSGS